MKITLSYTICTATPWNPKFDSVGKFQLRERKSPEELREERQLKKQLYGSNKINPMRTETHSVFEVKDNTCYFLLGNWHRLKEALDKEQEPYTVEEAFDPTVTPEPDYSVLSGVELRSGQAEALASIVTARTGMICSTIGFGKSFIISLLCRMYPTLNILVVCPSGEVVKELYRDISKVCPGQTGLLNMDNTEVNGKRIIVTTTKSMAKLDPKQVQLMLFDECHSVGYNATGNDVLKFCFCRRFGFTATPIRNQGDYIAMESLFGPVLQEISFAQAEAAGSVTPISYMMFPLNKLNPKLADLVEIQKPGEEPEFISQQDLKPWFQPTGRHKKRGFPDYLKNKLYYVSNYYRNDAIVDIFFRIKQAAPNTQILIMVQSIEHMIRLCERIKCAAFMHGERGSLEKYRSKKGLEHVDMSKYEQSSKQLAETKSKFEKGSIKHAVSTTVLKQGVNLSHLAVLIRADAAVSGVPSVQIPGRLARLAENKPMAYLIDFTDNFCEDASGRAKCRQREYKKQGWAEVDQLETIIQNLKEFHQLPLTGNR